jgi:hypothetical protein
MFRLVPAEQNTRQKLAVIKRKQNSIHNRLTRPRKNI